MVGQNLQQAGRKIQERRRRQQREHNRLKRTADYWLADNCAHSFMFLSPERAVPLAARPHAWLPLYATDRQLQTSTSPPQTTTDHIYVTLLLLRHDTQSNTFFKLHKFYYFTYLVFLFANTLSQMKYGSFHNKSIKVKPWVYREARAFCTKWNPSFGN